MDDVIIFHGRFQPFHMGHIRSLQYIVESTNKNIVIGIVNYNPTNIDKFDNINFSNFDLRRNPLNYWHRYYSIKLSIDEMPWSHRIIGIVPMPRLSLNVRNADNYIPDRPRTICVYKKRNDDRERIKTEAYIMNEEEVFEIPIYSFDSTYKMISGKLLRSLMAINHDIWEILVPDIAKNYYKEINISGIIRSLISEDYAKIQLKEVINREPSMELKEYIYELLSATYNPTKIRKDSLEYNSLSDVSHKLDTLDKKMQSILRNTQEIKIDIKIINSNLMNIDYYIVLLNETYKESPSLTALLEEIHGSILQQNTKTLPRKLFDSISLIASIATLSTHPAFIALINLLGI